MLTEVAQNTRHHAFMSICIDKLYMLNTLYMQNKFPAPLLHLKKKSVCFCCCFGLCFVASEFLTTICHLAIVNVCVIIILSIGNTQISILLLISGTYLLS